MSEQQRIDAAIADQTTATRRRYDRILWLLILAHLPLTMGLVPLGYGTWGFAAAGSLLLGAIATGAWFTLAGTRSFGVVAAILLMGLSAVMIQSQLGRIEMHFHIFGALALLLIYRDWLPLVAAAAVIAIHHVVLTYLQLEGVQLGDMPVMVFSYGCNWGITALHAAFVVFETAILVYYAHLLAGEQYTSAGINAAVRAIEEDRDLTFSVPGEESDPTARAFNQTMAAFAGLARQTRESAEDIANEAGGLADSARHTDELARGQQSQASQAASSATEMSQSIQEVAASAQATAEAASTANDHANAGAGTVEQSVADSRKLGDAMSRAGDSVNQLADKAGNINKMVEVIRGISEQTNLLALNAAIEAARAGEAGRGFAVVADEVRNLAQRSHDSTEEIEQTISEVQEQTRTTVEQIEEARGVAATNAENMQSVNEAFQSVVGAVSDISERTSSIASATEEQSTAAEHIAETVETISGQGASLTSTAEQDSQRVETLRELSRTLAERAGAYRA